MLTDFVTTQFYASPCSIKDDVSQLRQFFRIVIEPTQPGETERDPLPHINFVGVPQSSNPSGAERYLFEYDGSDNQQGDTFPTVVATNPRTTNSGLGFAAPQYYF
jgi:hypothetical protein